MPSLKFDLPLPPQIDAFPDETDDASSLVLTLSLKHEDENSYKIIPPDIGVYSEELYTLVIDCIDTEYLGKYTVKLTYSGQGYLTS